MFVFLIFVVLFIYLRGERDFLRAPSFCCLNSAWISFSDDGFKELPDLKESSGLLIIMFPCDIKGYSEWMPDCRFYAVARSLLVIESVDPGESVKLCSPLICKALVLLGCDDVIFFWSLDALMEEMLSGPFLDFLPRWEERPLLMLLGFLFFSATTLLWRDPSLYCLLSLFNSVL
jgi:hypothetical protein